MSATYIICFITFDIATLFRDSIHIFHPFINPNFAVIRAFTIPHFNRNFHKTKY